jgi:hypothetical protein
MSNEDSLRKSLLKPLLLSVPMTIWNRFLIKFYTFCRGFQKYVEKFQFWFISDNYRGHYMETHYVFTRASNVNHKTFIGEKNISNKFSN